MDDPRNTDNAWVVSTAYHVHDNHDFFSTFELAGQPARGCKDMTDIIRIPLEVGWVVAHRDLELYASHLEILKVVVDKKKAYWGQRHDGQTDR